jgi:isoquinoline 1-oxidoreductase alpha subunit
MPEYTIRVNGGLHQVEASPAMPLLWVLRDLLGLTGTKFGCGIGQCGACTVQIDGTPVRSCSTPISAVGKQEVKTVEGLSTEGLHALQRAWIAEEVPQCGYCQAGQLMTAAALLDRSPNPSDDEIDAALSGNLCRCGTYTRIRAAIHRAAKES